MDGSRLLLCAGMQEFVVQHHVTSDVEWKVKLIVSITVEHRLPLSFSIPVALLIGLLMAMMHRG